MKEQIKVIKRNGESVPVRLDEITDRIADLAKDLDEIDPIEISIEVVKKFTTVFQQVF